MKKLVLFSTLLLVLSQAIAVESQNREVQAIKQSRYALTFSRNLSSVHVEATLPETPPDLEIPLGAADDQPRGFATFIHDLQASHDGTAIQLTPVGKSAWTLSQPSARPLKLSYTVDLSYCRSKWPAGNEKAGILLDGDLFLVTKPLFISDPHNRTGAKISIGFPAGMHLTTPWMQTAPGRFVTKTREELIDNSLVLGIHPCSVFQKNGNTLTLALLGSIRQSKHLLDKTLRSIVDRYSKVFPASKSYRQLVTLFYSDEENGEAYANSSAFTTVLPVESATTLMWANTLAHETMHYWTGGLIHFSDHAAGEWFTEGFTEYMANQALVQAGIFDETTYIRKAEKNMANYEYCRFSSFFRDVSLQDSGKLKTRYHLAVYNGGWCIAFALDTMIREHSNGKRTLSSLLDKLYRDYSVPGRPVTIDGLAKAASAFVGRDMAGFFRDYVQGKATLPLDKYCETVGYRLMLQQYAAEAYLSPNPSASQRQKEMRKAWLHG